MSTNFENENQPLTDWISQAEAARIRGVSRQAINKLVQNGQLRSLKVGGHVLVSRSQVESFSPQPAGRPGPTASPLAEQIRRLLANCDARTRAEIYKALRDEMPPHPLESRLGVDADVILEALHRAGDLTLRMFRGVIAEAAFEINVVRRLAGWRSESITGNPPFDFLLGDATGAVRVQVKLQRSERGRPLMASGRLSADMYVVETQRTRGGKDRTSGSSTRPYKFGEFDLIAVSMQPSTGRWDSFLYTISDWLLPTVSNPAELATFQPVPSQPNEDWTDDFETCVTWFRSGKKRTIGGLR